MPVHCYKIAYALQLKYTVVQIYFFMSLFILFSVAAVAQGVNRVVDEQCGTMLRLQAKFESNPELKIRFEARRQQFNKAFKNGSYKLSRSANTSSSSTIPVVFHIVMNDPNTVTDDQIQAQLETLNTNFAGLNADSTKVPSYFKSLFARSSIQFCLAQQTPGGESTSGIERVTTRRTSFTANDAVKHASTGGADIWNGDNYVNIWICALSNNILGYSTFPDDGIPDEQGIVIDYRTLPGGTFAAYNTGKTLTHEAGHYFNLYHIWGDDEGACSGTDYVDDTPNQSASSSGCYSGIRTDNCTPSGNGIMYQNYMDYSSDACLVMFTTEQAGRMESAFLEYRYSLLTSIGCQPPAARNYDVELTSIGQPVQRLCTGAFTPAVTIKNKGRNTLTKLTISAHIDGGSISSYTWTGTLAYLETTSINLKTLNTETGLHTFTVYVTNPNDEADEDPANDSLSLAYQYYNAVKNVSEGFEGSQFPPEGWDVVNSDNTVTWQKNAGVAHSGNASAMMHNFEYSSPGAIDDLRLPTIMLTGVDSAFLSFTVAAAAYTALNTPGNIWDTLEVLASTDCGQTYTSLYKKYGSGLVTTARVATTEFVPSADEWRKDSIDLKYYIGMSDVMLVFRNTNGYENNIYLDDINIRTVTINANLKSKGFLVTPNPASDAVTVQFYPPPAGLRAIQVFTMSGQKIIQIPVNGQINTYNINLGRYAPGIYIVTAVFADRILSKKIIKL